MSFERQARNEMDEQAQVEVVLDGRAYRVRPGTTLAMLVNELGHGPEQVTTAVNGSFVRRDQRAGCVLQAGDAVLLFQPIVGG